MKLARALAVAIALVIILPCVARALSPDEATVKQVAAMAAHARHVKGKEVRILGAMLAGTVPDGRPAVLLAFEGRVLGYGYDPRTKDGGVHVRADDGTEVWLIMMSDSPFPPPMKGWRYRFNVAPDQGDLNLMLPKLLGR